MTRRSTSQTKIDEYAFPVVVRVLTPERGLGSLGLDQNLWQWLNDQVGPGNYAITPHHAVLGDGVAVNLRSVEDALAFVRRFPMLVLSDATMSRSYSSPLARDPEWETEAVCNLYSLTKTQDTLRQLFPTPLLDRLGNFGGLPEIYPDYHAPIIRQGAEGREMVLARWGLPTPPQFLIGKKTDRGVTNIRNTKSPHWRRWLGPESRCLVPLTSFAEPNAQSSTRSNVWFSRVEEGPAFFAGIWTRWTSVRKLKDGETTDDLYGFLTTEPNAVVGPVHPKAMPVILTEPEEWDTWLAAPWGEAAKLQRPLRDALLRTVSIKGPYK